MNKDLKTSGQELISVILPYYNEEKYIASSLQSVLNSDYSNLEIICVDDGSTDSSAEKVASFRDPRIITLSQENLGISQARNAGLNRARGDYIFFLDADDVIYPDYISKMYQSAKDHQAQVVISNYQIKNDKGVFPLPDLKEGVYPGIQPIFFELYTSSHFNPPWNKLYRRDIIQDQFDPALSLGEDLVFNLSTLDRCSSISVINENGYLYTKRKDGLHAQKQSTKELLYLYEQIQNYMNLQSPEFRWHLQKHFVRHCYEQKLSLHQEMSQLADFFHDNNFSFTAWNGLVLTFWNQLYRMKRGLKR